MSIVDEKVTRYPIRQIAQKFFPLFQDFTPKFLLGFIFILGATLMETLIPIWVGKNVDVAVAPGAKVTDLYRPLIGLFFICLLRAAFEWFQTYYVQITGQGVTHRLRQILFAKIIALPVPYFDKNPAGRLLTRVLNDIKALSEVFTASMSVLVLDAMVIIGTVIAMFFVHFKSALMISISIPIVFLTIHYFGTRLAGMYRVVRAKVSQINAFLGENISAVATIQRLAAEDERAGKFKAIILDHDRAQRDSLHLYSMVQPVTNTLNGLVLGGLIAVGGYDVIHNQMSLGTLVAMIGFVKNLFQPIRDLVEKYNTFLSAIVSAERIMGLLEEPSEINSGKITKVAHDLQAPTIKFESVTFQYEGRSQPAVRNVSFEIKPGSSCAVVGSTGGGKSTLIRLLYRFYDVQSGKIKFKGHDLNDWNKAALRSQLCMVPQELYLFEGTLRDNLTLGKREMTESALKEVCEKVYLWDLVRGRGGLDLWVNEGGSNLSVGEKQLIAFGRLLVWDPEVFILDEATASLDGQLEHRLMEALKIALKGRTSLIVAHRLSTIRSCDQILVVEDGMIAERGGWDELLSKRGKFAEFYELFTAQEAHSEKQARI